MKKLSKKRRSPQPEQDSISLSTQTRWISLLHFTIKSHYLVLVPALILAIASGIVIPALAVFLGLIFQAFSDYGAGNTAPDEFSNQVIRYTLYLLFLGAASWALQAGFLLYWLLFGELQARSARSQLYACMLDKPMEWFDMRTSGINGLMPRVQR
jgi:ATP-binding cassette, subfamily B (MDR/TAP), member 1